VPDRRGEAYRAAVYLMRRQIVWNRSTRRAGVRGGAQVGRPRWLRILSITGGPSIPVLSLTKERVSFQGANVALLQCLETLLHLLSRDVLPVQWPSLGKVLGAFEPADDHRIEAGVSD